MAFKKLRPGWSGDNFKPRSKGQPNPYHPETCPPNCPKCEAQRGAAELQEQSNKLILSKHLIQCAVYDVPEKPCNCGKTGVR